MPVLRRTRLPAADGHQHLRAAGADRASWKLATQYNFLDRGGSRQCILYYHVVSCWAALMSSRKTGLLILNNLSLNFIIVTYIKAQITVLATHGMCFGWWIRARHHEK
jgi:hypothetical protein